MASSVPQTFVKQYSANVFHLSQQKGSRLQSLTRNESQHSESAFYDRIGEVEAIEKVGRNQDVVIQDVPHSRRRVTTRDYYYASMVDQEDKLRMIQSPESQYALAAAMTLGRKIDDIIISAALGTASAGKEGELSVAFPDAQVVAAFDGTTTTGVGLNVKTLIAIKQKFLANEVEPGDLYIVVSARQLSDLLNEDKVTNSDYAAIKALVNGDVDTFMGFKFIHSERLPVTATTTTYVATSGAIGSGSGSLSSGARRCFAWKKDGLLLSIASGVDTKMDPIPEKFHAVQILAKLSMGAVRMEEEKVVEIRCKE